MPLIMLRSNWPGIFHQDVRDADGERMLAFAPGEPVEVGPADLAAIEDHIGRAFVFVRTDGKGRPEIVATPEEATAALVKTADGDLPDEPPGPDAGDEDKPLEELTIAQLLDIADQENVELVGKKKKPEIIAALKAAGIE
jgi:hypothetical protein